ncbi:MFS transporter [Patescibacteria group bacterium]|nr:MFS transporter [Patescibacteria group bacterium]
MFGLEPSQIVINATREKLMGYHEAVARNPRLLFWGRVFRETKMMAAVVMFFYDHRGVPVNQVFYLSIFWAIFSLLSEVPSGYLADRIGRKQTILLGVVLMLMGDLMQFYAFGFWQFAIIFSFWSLGFSCLSGTEEAMLYDSLKETGEAGLMNEKNARLEAARFAPRAIGPVIGSYIAKDLLETQFQIVIGIDVLLTIIGIGFALRLTEPKICTSMLSQRRIFRQSIATINKHPWLLRAKISQLLVFFAGFLLFRAWQPFFVDKGATVLMLGGFYFCSRLLFFVMYWHVAEIAKRFGTALVINVSALLAMPLLALSFLLDDIWLIMIFFTIAHLMIDGRIPLFAKSINQRIDSNSRATTLSVLNMLKSVLDIPFLLVAGLVTANSMANAVVGAIILCSIAVIFFWSKEKEFEDIKL